MRGRGEGDMGKERATCSCCRQQKMGFTCTCVCVRVCVCVSARAGKGRTMRLPNSYAPMTNGTVLTAAANQICQPTSTGPGTYPEAATVSVTTVVSAGSTLLSAADVSALPRTLLGEGVAVLLEWHGRGLAHGRRRAGGKAAVPPTRCTRSDVFAHMPCFLRSRRCSGELPATATIFRCCCKHRQLLRKHTDERIRK